VLALALAARAAAARCDQPLAPPQGAPCLIQLMHASSVAPLVPRAFFPSETIAGGCRPLRERLDRYFFANDERSVAEIVLDLCREQSFTLATAESETGGMVAQRLTAVPGSSDVFRGAAVAYSDDVKVAELDVPPGVLERHGAVSAETAAAMAAGARVRLRADVAVAVTGIAGPGGGTPEKPVGLVYLHAAGPGGELALDLDIPGGRESVRSRSAAAALHLVRRLLTQSRDERV